MKADDAMATTVELLVEQIEAGAGSWTMPWNGAAVLPRNAVTGARYRGGNVLALMCSAIANAFTSPDWATYKQWAAAGAQVRKGAHSTRAIIWKDTTRDGDGDAGKKRSVYASAFSLFNRDQVDGDVDPAQMVRTDSHVFFDAIPYRLAIGNCAYAKAIDTVMMPPGDSFTCEQQYYDCLAHELGHWTGHPTRLNRDMGGRFGDDAYAVEELIAELSSAFTMDHVICYAANDGLMDRAKRIDHAPYLASWIKVLRAEPKILWTVASKAQAATDHLTSYSMKELADATATA